MQAFPKWRDNPKFVFLNVEIIGRDDWSKPVVYAKLEVKGARAFNSGSNMGSLLSPAAPRPVNVDYKALLTKSP